MAENAILAVETKKALFDAVYALTSVVPLVEPLKLRVLFQKSSVNENALVLCLASRSSVASDVITPAF